MAVKHLYPNQEWFLRTSTRRLQKTNPKQQTSCVGIGFYHMQQCLNNHIMKTRSEEQCWSSLPHTPHTHTPSFDMLHDLQKVCRKWLDKFQAVFGLALVHKVWSQSSFRNCTCTSTNKKLLGAPGLATRSKDATRGSFAKLAQTKCRPQEPKATSANARSCCTMKRCKCNMKGLKPTLLLKII